MSKSIILLIFLSIINRNNTHLKKFKISNCILFFNLKIKVHMTQSLGDIVYLFSINNGQKFNRKIKIHI